MSELGKRLFHSIESAGYSPSGAAKAIELSAQAPQNWKDGKIGVDTLIALLHLIKADANWILLGDAQSTQEPVRLPYSRPAAQNWIAVQDNALSPILKVGDSVRIDNNKQASAGDFVLAECDGVQILRKYRPRGFGDSGKPYSHLAPINDDYPAIDSRYQEFHVLGVATEYKRQLIQQ